MIGFNKKDFGYVIFGMLFLMAIIPGVFALSTDMKDSYKQEETMIFEIKGNLLENIGKEQVDFKRGHVSVPLEFDVKRLGDRQFIWGIAPSNENNYSLFIEDIVTTINGKVSEVNFEKNFSVLSEKTDYNIKPGFILTKEDFTIDLFLFVDEEIEIEISYGESSGTERFNPGENEIDFSVSNLDENEIVDIKIGDYILPLYFIGESSDNSEDIERILPDFRFKPRVIESFVIDNGRELTYPVQIINSGDEEIVLVLEYDKSIFRIDKDEIRIQKDSIYDFNFSIVEFPKDRLDEKIYAKSGNFSIELALIIEPTENADNVNTPYLEDGFVESQLYYCSELNGVKCSTGESCDGELQNSLEGSCCIGSCKTVDEKSGYGIWGWLIAGIIILIIGIVFMKYKKTKNSGDEKFKERVKIAEDRGKFKTP